MDQLAEYSAPGQTINHGLYLGSVVNTDHTPVGRVTDSTIRKQLQQWQLSKVLPTITPNSLYFLYLEPGVVSVMGGSRSCQNYCDYHDAAGNLYYAVMPYPLCTGWYDDAHGEIGDICAWNFKKVGAHTVQQEWSNAQNRCV